MRDEYNFHRFSINSTFISLLFSLSPFCGVKISTFSVVLRVIWYHGGPSGVQDDFWVSLLRAECEFLSDLLFVIFDVLGYVQSALSKELVYSLKSKILEQGAKI